VNNTARLEAELDTANAVIATMNAHIDSLRAYLNSPKFHSDPSVQTADIFARLYEMRSAVADTECEGRGTHSDLVLKYGQLKPAANVEYPIRDTERAYHWLGMSRD
jgi:hypothetical protein